MAQYDQALDIDIDPWTFGRPECPLGDRSLHGVGIRYVSPQALLLPQSTLVAATKRAFASNYSLAELHGNAGQIDVHEDPQDGLDADPVYAYSDATQSTDSPATPMSPHLTSPPFLPEYIPTPDPSLSGDFSPILQKMPAAPASLFSTRARVLLPPFDCCPYTTTVSVAQWQEFTARPSTLAIWRRKSVLGDRSDVAKYADRRWRKYEWTHVYVCAHAGSPRDRRDPTKQRRKSLRVSIKCGCKSRITAGKVADKDSVVVRWAWVHNGHDYQYRKAAEIC